ncbi:hypothetical protein ABT186_46445 [Streptomyces sp. NPDC001634]
MGADEMPSACRTLTSTEYSGCFAGRRSERSAAFHASLERALDYRRRPRRRRRPHPDAIGETVPFESAIDLITSLEKGRKIPGRRLIVLDARP